MAQAVRITDEVGRLIFDNVSTAGTGAGQTSVGATTTAILATNDNRHWASIVNDSDETIYLGLGTAAILNQGIRLNANGGSYNINAVNLFTGAINGISTSGSKVVTKVEG